MSSKVYGPDTTTDDVLAGIDLSNKITLVTGASGGIGLETARALASKGARVILGVRDRKKGKTAMDTIIQNVPGADIRHCGNARTTLGREMYLESETL